MASSTGKCILVTGASKGLGLACARILLEKFGCNVVTLSRSSTKELQDLESEYPERLEAVQGDVSNEQDQQKAVDAAISKHGRLDGVVLNAGALEPLARVANADIAEYKKLFDINFFSLVTMLKIAIPHLRESKGRCIFTSSGAATGAYTAWSAYNASKAALNSLCRTVAAEEQDITFVAVRPGVVDTGMQDLLLATGKAEMSPSDYQKFVDTHQQGKRIPPQKPGHVLAALACEAEHTLSGEFVNWADDSMQKYSGEA